MNLKRQRVGQNACFLQSRHLAINPNWIPVSEHVKKILPAYQASMIIGEGSASIIFDVPHSAIAKMLVIADKDTSTCMDVPLCGRERVRMTSVLGLVSGQGRLGDTYYSITRATASRSYCLFVG